MSDLVDRLTDVKKLMELSSFLSFPVSMMAYISTVGVGGFLLRNEAWPLVLAYPWGAFEGLMAAMLFMQVVFFIGSYMERMNFPAVVGAILVSFGMFVFVPEKQLPMQAFANPLWHYASLIMGIVFMKSAYDEQKKTN